jgi:hypothetical protein
VADVEAWSVSQWRAKSLLFLSSGRLEFCALALSGNFGGTKWRNGQLLRCDAILAARTCPAELRNVHSTYKGEVMSQLNTHDLEGRILAHRKLLIALLDVLARAAPNPDAVWNDIRESASLLDHEEDPGVLPDAGFAIQVHETEELRSIITQAELRFRRSRRT